MPTILAHGLWPERRTREFNLTPAGTGMVASAITFGAIVGALLGGYLTDKIGRYRVFMADMLFLWWQRSPARWPPTNTC